MKKVYTIFGSALLFSFLLIRTSAIPIGPDKYFIDIQDPNKVDTYQLNVYGKQDLDKEQKIYFSTVGMRKVGNENEREFYIPNREDQNEAANWVKLESTEAVIHPGETLTIPWTLQIPTDHKCGTTLAGIMISNKPEETNVQSSAITITKEVVSQVHINFPNSTNQECKNSVVNQLFRIPKVFKIFNYDNIPFETTLENNGDYISRSPKGFIEIFGLGDKVSIEFNNENLDIYPQTARKFQNIWIDPNYPHNGNFFQKLGYEITHLRIGRYEARLGVTKNVNQNIVAYDHFWIIPWRVLLLLGVIIPTISRVLFLKRSNNRKS